jgi:hypothetical protein
MKTLLFFLHIFSAIMSLHASLLPPSEMHPISPPDLTWHLKVFTPPDEYLIYLSPHYTISSHFSTIGKDLSPHIRRRWEDCEIFEHAHYIIYSPDRVNLDLIRRDSGVDSVYEHAEYQAIDDPVDEEDGMWGKKGEGRREL